MDECTECLSRRRLQLFLIGAEHALKLVDRRENDFGYFRAVRLRYLNGKNVLKFVADLAELGKTASRRVSLQCVDRATHTPDQFFVSGSSLELQPGVVDHLEQLSRALKKEGAEFRTTILGEQAQGATSSRL